jgi:hypothetical protein
MPAPFPREARLKQSPLSADAAQIYGHYTWLARWSAEICADREIDHKKLAQLAYGKGSHCAWFVSLVPAELEPDSGLAVCIEARFYQEGLSWPSREAQVLDLKGIRAAAAALHQYVMEKVPAVRIASDLMMTDLGLRDEPRRMPKNDPELVRLIEALRAEFAD